MKQFFLRLWTDESFASRCLRVVLLFVGQLIHEGVIPTGSSGFGYYVGPVIAAAALFIPAGEMNNSPPKP